MSRYANPLVDAWQYRGLLLERWGYEPGPPSNIERHVHAEYQIGVALDRAGVYEYRHRTEPVPGRSLVIIHPGEPHAVRDTGPRVARARYLMMYLDPAWLTRPFGLEAHDDALPFFPGPLAQDRLVAAFRRTFRLTEDPLELECRLVALAARLRSHAKGAAPPEAVDPGDRLLHVREMLHDEPFADTSLEDLARAAGLSQWHLLRSFEERFGLPPHRFRLMLRIDIARRRLAEGEPLTHVALATGFYDQSHFGRHFRRIVGTTPGRYRIRTTPPPYSNFVL